MDRRTSKRALGLLAVAVAVAVAAPRLVLVLLAPLADGDGAIYGRVAHNILHHGCVSLSNVAGGACAPHWGGNQLPGYPAFIAAAWMVAGESIRSALVAQTLAFAVAAAYFVEVQRRSGASRTVLAAVVAVLSLSPALVAWPRMLLTETLAAAMALWLLAALTRSLAEGRVRVAELGLALAVAVFVRANMVLFLVPIALLAAHLHGRKAATHVAVIAVFVATPVAGWAWRNVNAGIGAVPPLSIMSDGSPAPTGVLRWMGTWVSSQYDLPHSVWPLLGGSFFQIGVPASHRDIAGPLVAALVAGVPNVDPELDRQFAALAKARRAADPVQLNVVLPLRRAVSLWLNPFASMGMPAESGGVRPALLSAMSEGRWRAATALMVAEFPTTLTKGAVTAWRYAVLLAAAWLILRDILARRVTGVGYAAAVCLTFTLVIAATPFVETRYLVPCLVWLEMTVTVTLAEFIGRRGLARTSARTATP